jgi:hypothetical protein
LQTFSGNNMYTDVRTSERSFAAQLSCIEKTLEAKTDWMPFLEPWHGVGIYAEMFGCSYDWELCEYPQTRYAVHSVEEARRIRKPRWQDGEIARLVIDSIRYYKSKVGDAIPIACTDTQSPIDTATLIWQTDSFLLACFEEPETVHRLLDMVTDLKIEFTRIQLEAIGENAARPGHNACLSRPWRRSGGIGVSDDLATVVSPAIYEEFARPYNERMARELGGVVVHSCGVWRPQIIRAVLETRGLMGVELALSRDDDPTPSQASVIRDGFRGSGIPVKARLGRDFMSLVEAVHAPDLVFIPHIAWVDDPVERDRNYDALRGKMAALDARDR